MRYRSSSTGFVKPFLVIILILLGACALCLAIAFFMGGDKDKGSAVDFTAADVTGAEVKLSEVYANGGAVLIFYDRAQNESKALLTHIAAAKKGSSVTTILIARGEADSKVLTDFLKENSLGADIVINDTDGKLFATYHIAENDKVPLTYFINREGSIRAVSVSNLTLEAAEKYVSYLTK